MTPAPNLPAGLREAHAHIPSHGRSLSMLNLASCQHSSECLDQLARHARQLDQSESTGGPRAWVLAFGARTEGWTDRRWPSRAEFDRVLGDRACCIMSFDHHAVCANTRALVLAGLREDSPDPPGGVICRDAQSQAPTGVLLESAAYRVWNAAPEPTAAERRDHVRAALRDLAGHGFIEVHDLLSPGWLGPLLAALDDVGELPLSVELFASVSEIELTAERARIWRRDRVRLGGGKLFADGTLNSRTAWMLTPYVDPLPHMPMGKPMVAQGELVAAVRRCERLGLPLATHAIGDGAVRAVLDAIELVACERISGNPGPRVHHRIEHAELIDDSDIPRFARLGVVASVQPCHLLTDIEVLTRSLPDRLGSVLPLRALIDDGCVPGELLVFGSDTPIVRPDPNDSVVAAVSRRRPGMSLEQSIGPAQAITEHEAWAAFGAN